MALGIVVVVIGSLLIAKFGITLDRHGFPRLVSFPLVIVVVIVFSTAVAVVMTYFDPNYTLDTLPFWPDGWLEGH